jgi:Protein of unknown function (DUF4435)
MPENRVSYLRRERVTAATILRSVIREFSSQADAVFCFFEGEDAGYYSVRIRQELYKYKFVFHNCDGKRTLRRVYQTLSDNQSLSELRGMFFFDRDYDFEIGGLDPKTCFVTDGYSIENYYVSSEAFERIIRSAFFADQVYDEGDVVCVSALMSAYRRSNGQISR